MTETAMLQPQLLEPDFILTPPRLLDVNTGWRPFETIIGDLADRFCRKNSLALEFGVEYGFSISAISNYFSRVIGVDHFKGDEHAGFTQEGVNRYEETRKALEPFENVRLIPLDWETFSQIILPEFRFDLIHVDIFHDYDTTFGCGSWAVEHSDCVLFHDTHHPAFDGVVPAIRDIAAKYKELSWYDSQEGSGLSILVRQ